jgi:CheY-like chemotaxis protein
VRDILRTLAAQKRIAIDLTVDPEVSQVVADPSKLKQVLYNYLSNAFKFTPDEGRVWVRVFPESPEAFRLEVQDTGIGIRAEDLARLFVEFQQLDASAAKKYAGTGLGLALTKRIVEAQGGRVGVESEAGKGSTFFAVLPRRALRGSVEPTAAPDVQTQPSGDRRVLVIDDDATDRRWLFRTLSEAGFAVEMASSGVEGLESCRIRVYDAVLLDLLLPDIDGREVLRAIRSGGPNRHTPVIIVTVVAEKGVGAGFHVDDILQKPVAKKDLLAALNRASVSPSAPGPIFVIDDDRAALKLAERTLKDLGYRPVCHAGAAQALESIATEAPAAVVLDLLMPGMDGFEFLSRFRRTAAGRRTPVIVWTVKDLSSREREELESLAQSVVSKSAGAKALIEELETYVVRRDPVDDAGTGLGR